MFSCLSFHLSRHPSCFFIDVLSSCARTDPGMEFSVRKVINLGHYSHDSPGSDFKLLLLHGHPLNALHMQPGHASSLHHFITSIVSCWVTVLGALNDNLLPCAEFWLIAVFLSQSSKVCLFFQSINCPVTKSSTKSI